MLLLPPPDMLAAPVVNITAFDERHMLTQQIEDSPGRLVDPAIDLAGVVIERFHPEFPRFMGWTIPRFEYPIKDIIGHRLGRAAVTAYAIRI
jgi:hypothetical protein